MVSKLMVEVFTPTDHDPQTPDTSDHSSDDWKSVSYHIGENADAVSGTVTPVDQWSAARIDKLREAASNSSAHILEQLFLDVATQDLIAQAIRLQEFQSESWLVRFALQCVATSHEDFGEYKAALLAIIGLHLIDQFVSEATLANLYSLSSALQEKLWSKESIETFHSIFSGSDLTWKDVKGKLPDKSHSEIRFACSSLPPLDWTTKEKRLISNSSSRSLHYLMTQLPFRTLQDIETYILTNFPLDLSDEEDSDFLSDAVVRDLTLPSLTENFADIPLAVLSCKIRVLYNLDTLPLSTNEKAIVAAAVKKNLSVDRIVEDLPCRSFEYIDEQYKSVKFMSTRKSKFRTQNERLVYEAQWTVLENSNDSTISSSRRSRRKQVVLPIPEIKPSLPRVKLSPEELEKKKLAAQKQKLLAAERKEKKLQERKELQALRAARLEKPKKPKTATKISLGLKDLLAGLAHFISIKADEDSQELGQKRKRLDVSYKESDYVAYYVLEEPKAKKQKLEYRLRAAEILKKKKALLLEAAKAKKKAKLEAKKKLKAKKKKAKKKKAKKQKKAKVFKQEESDQEESSQEDEVKPFSPTDLDSDTLIPLHGRQLFDSGFYSNPPVISKLNMIDLSNAPDSMSTSGYDVMTLPNDIYLYEDDLAKDIIKGHMKSYRSLPISFPSFFNQLSEDREVNSRNIIRIRYLLYPEHSELFILCEPKSNELDPIQEILKLIMIHFALYFSHSEELQTVITREYCDKLQQAIEENDFGEFMFVIDSWNELMVRLSPNVEGVLAVEGRDLNPEIREYLGSAEKRIPTDDDLRLDLFYLEITLEPTSPKFNAVEFDKLAINGNIAKTSIVTEGISRGSSSTPSSVSTFETITKPQDFAESFFARLSEKSTVSRFAMHQILQRAYSRVVSTASRQLRSYKAFTAEVYGELLPSFTSEVLQKVDLRPQHKFYDLGSGVGNTTFQAALEFGATVSGGCELMDHALNLTSLQEHLLQKHLKLLGLKQLNLDFALLQSFVCNLAVRKLVLDCDVLIVNNYLFDVNLNSEVGRLLEGLRPGTKIISLKSFIRPRYRATGDTIFDKLKVEKHEMSDFCSVSWTASKVPYYISTVQDRILPEYLGKEDT